MFQKVSISPSLLSADFMRLSEEVDALKRAGADWLHFDVIDGVFAPNLTVGVPVLRKLRSYTDLPIDVHLMVCDPLAKLPWFLDCNPDYLTVHWEAFGQGREEDDAKAVSRMIRSAGAKASVALRPDTPIGVLDTTLGLWDMVLVMSVQPGFSGQSYQPESADRVRELVLSCEAKGVAPLIQVDGGIDAVTARLVCAFGADVLVAGNAVFAQDDYTQAIHDIRASAQSAQGESRGQSL